MCVLYDFFFFKQKTAYEMLRSLVGSEMCIRDSVGTALGLLWCLAANAFELIRVPVDIYQISYVPFRIMPLDLFLIIGTALSISLISTLFPSHRAAKVNPVTALKYE